MTEGRRDAGVVMNGCGAAGPLPAQDGLVSVEPASDHRKADPRVVSELMFTPLLVLPHFFVLSQSLRRLLLENKTNAVSPHVSEAPGLEP